MEKSDYRESEMNLSRWALLASLYMTSFVGPGFFLIALVSILRKNGASLHQLSLVYLLGVFWILKVFWAPLVDGFKFPKLGHFRGWLIISQSFMVVCLIIISRFDVIKDFYTILLLCTVQAFFSATQDIAADGLAVKLLSIDERGMGNSVQSAFGLIGNMVGGGFVLMAFPWLQWKGAMYILAFIVFLSLVQLIFFREDCCDEVIKNKKGYLRLFASFFNGGSKHRWLFIMFFFSFGIGLEYGLMVPVLSDLGWSLSEIGFVTNISGIFVGIVSSLSTGLLIGWLGRKRVLICSGIVSIIGIPALILPLKGFTEDIIVFISVGIFYMVYSFITVIMTTIMMDLASAENPATEYTLQFSFFSVVGFFAIIFANIMAEFSGYIPVLILGASCGALALMFSINYKTADLSVVLSDSGVENQF